MFRTILGLFTFQEFGGLSIADLMMKTRWSNAEYLLVIDNCLLIVLIIKYIVSYYPINATPLATLNV